MLEIVNEELVGKSIGEITFMARSGNMYAQYEFGRLNGSPEIGVYYLQKAAKQGLMQAQKQLGLIYMNGWVYKDMYDKKEPADRIEIDITKAKYWLNKSAKQGDEESKLLLKKLKETSKV